MMLCKVTVTDGKTKFTPLTEVTSMEEAKEFATIDFNPNQSEFVVVQVIGAFKAKMVVDFEDTEWSK